MTKTRLVLCFLVSLVITSVGAAVEIPDAARKELAETLGGPFLVYRDKVFQELKLSDEQKNALLDKFPDYVQETMKVFDKLKDAKPAEREKEMQEHCRKCDEKLSSLLKDLLETGQQERLFQLQLQKAGAFALIGEHESFLNMKITAEQRKKFVDVVQVMEKKVQSLIKDAEAKGKIEEARSKVLKLRKEHEGKFEAILDETQKKQWKELLGKPFALGD